MVGALCASQDLKCKFRISIQGSGFRVQGSRLVEASRKNLVLERDVRGWSHVHCTRSDGFLESANQSDERMSVRPRPKTTTAAALSMDAKQHTRLPRTYSGKLMVSMLPDSPCSCTQEKMLRIFGIESCGVCSFASCRNWLPHIQTVSWGQELARGRTTCHRHPRAPSCH